MSEDTDQNAPVDPDSAQASQDVQVKQPAESGSEQRPSAAGRWLVGIVFVLMLIALAASGYAFYLAYQLQAGQVETATRQQALSAEVDDLQNEIGRISVALADQREIGEALQATQKRLAERERMDESDWTLAEVEYLVTMAIQRLNLGGNVATALAALEAAAHRVKDINSPGLIPVREQLTSDINALHAVPEVDATGIALYLADLITRVEELPLNGDPLHKALGDSPAADAPVEGWRGVLGAVWDELRQLVVIQREDAPPAELLAPTERYYLYQNLRVELASARAAALRHDTRNLRASIELIQDWLARYFNTDAEAVANIQDSLRKMVEVDLEPKLPDISGSLESVRAWQKRQADEPGE